MPKARPTLTTLRRMARAGELAERDFRRLRRDSRVGVRAFAEREIRRLQRQAEERARVDGLAVREGALWADGVRYVAGVDEVGAGPLAGPVVAAAVILPADCRILGIDDSKRLSRKRREALDLVIRREAVAFGIGSCSPEEIDRINIFQASRKAMQRAVLALDPAPGHLLVDARTIPGVSVEQTAIIHGDSHCQVIAAASIVAKVYRDRLMTEAAETYPGYGFERHAGYGTRAHMNALRELGPAAIHRTSFAPVAAAVARARRA